MEQSLGRLEGDAMESNVRRTQEAYERVKGQETEMAAELQEMEREMSQFASGRGAPSRTFVSEKLEACKIQQVNARLPYLF